jgi:hypothetical protein
MWIEGSKVDDIGLERTSASTFLKAWDPPFARVAIFAVDMVE